MRFLPHPPSGPSPVEQFLRELVTALQARTPLDSPDIVHDHSAHGFTSKLKAAAASAAALELKWFLVTAQTDDGYTGTELNSAGQPTGTSVSIARPHEHRRTTWDTLSFNVGGYTIRYAYIAASRRTATITSVTPNVTESQQLIPSLIPNQTRLLALKPPGGTFITGVDWQDLNIAGRAWARV